jgi:hypothetical protein
VRGASRRAALSPACPHCSFCSRLFLTAPPPTAPLVQYVFNFQYDAAGGISLGLAATDKAGRAQHPRARAPVEADVRAQVVRLMRAITSVTSTLDAPPEAFFVFAKMVFTDATPEDYQPPGFVDAGEAAVGWFATRCAKRALSCLPHLP